MIALSPTGGNLALYNVHCKTYSLAKQLRRSFGNVTRVDMGLAIPNDGLFCFRFIPQYRSPEALKLRKQVADIVREDRQHGGKL